MLMIEDVACEEEFDTAGLVDDEKILYPGRTTEEDCLKDEVER